MSAPKGVSLELIAAVMERLPMWKSSDKPKVQSHEAYYLIQREALHARIDAMSEHSMVCKFPGMYSLCEKSHFTRAINFANKLDPVDSTHSWWPRTWILPLEMSECQEAITQTLAEHDADSKFTPVWIVKPESGTQGAGIFFASSAAQLEEKMATRLQMGDWVCQDYVHNPLLVDGLKFDLRMYVTVTSLDPPKMYCCKEGLARFCTVKYKPPDPKKGFGDEKAHLTNYHLNKESSAFIQAGEDCFSDDNKSSKRPMSTLFRQLRRRGYSHKGRLFDEEFFWDKCEQMLSVVVTAFLPVLRMSYARHFKTNAEQMQSGPCRSFQMLGVDVMMRDDFTPVLIEVNNSPSLDITQVVNPATDFAGNPDKQLEVSACDEHVKTVAFGGTLELLPKISPNAKAYLAAMHTEEGRFTVKPTARPISRQWFYEVGSCGQDEPRDVLRKIEIMFTKAGGAKKAFTAGALRQKFGKVPGLMKKGKFSKSDFDIVSAKWRGVVQAGMKKESMAEAGMRGDLAVLDWGVMTMQICEKRWAGSGKSVLHHMNALLDMMIDPAEAKRKRAAAKAAADAAAAEVQDGAVEGTGEEPEGGSNDLTDATAAAAAADLAAASTATPVEIAAATRIQASYRGSLVRRGKGDMVSTLRLAAPHPIQEESEKRPPSGLSAHSHPASADPAKSDNGGRDSDSEGSTTGGENVRSKAGPAAVSGRGQGSRGRGRGGRGRGGRGRGGRGRGGRGEKPTGVKTSGRGKVAVRAQGRGGGRASSKGRGSKTSSRGRGSKASGRGRGSKASGRGGGDRGGRGRGKASSPNKKALPSGIVPLAGGDEPTILNSKPPLPPIGTDAAKQHAAATKIQSTYRGYQVRRSKSLAAADSAVAGEQATVAGSGAPEEDQTAEADPDPVDEPTVVEDPGTADTPAVTTDPDAADEEQGAVGSLAGDEQQGTAVNPGTTDTAATTTSPEAADEQRPATDSEAIDEEQAAAIKIQAMYRGHRVRKRQPPPHEIGGASDSGNEGDGSPDAAPSPRHSIGASVSDGTLSPDAERLGSSGTDEDEAMGLGVRGRTEDSVVQDEDED